MKQQLPDITRSIMGGFEFAQNAKMNNLKMLAAEQEIQQKQQLRSLYNLASSGDPQAVQQLSMTAPDAYKGLKDYQNYRLQRGGQLANGILTAPLAVRPKVYKQAIQEYTNEFGQAPDVPAEYSPEAAAHLKYIVNQAREVEDVAKEEFARPKQAADIASTKASTYKTYKDAEKTGLEIEGLKSERDAMKAAGFDSPTAFKKSREEIGKATGEKAVLLRSMESKLPELLTSVNKLSELGKTATYTSTGLATDFAMRELGISPRQAAKDRAEYVARIDNQILPLLRDTFGAAFTQKEGESLKATLGDKNLSSAEKDAVLQAFIEQKVASIKSTQMELGMDQQVPNMPTKGKFSVMGNNVVQEGQTATNRTTGQTITFRGGRWQ